MHSGNSKKVSVAAVECRILGQVLDQGPDHVEPCKP